MKSISTEKLNLAIKNALIKLDKMTEKFTDSFPSAASVKGLYSKTDNSEGWTQCFYTGMLVLAYQLTKDEKYIKLAKELDKAFFERVDEMKGMSDHDIGFTFTLSTVATYKAIGEDIYREKSIRHL